MQSIRRSFSLAAAAIAMVTAASVAQANPTGNEVYDNRNSAAYDGFAMGAINAVAGMGQMFNYICTPDNTTLGQLRDLVTQELTANPKIRNYEYRVIAASVLRKHYPCSGNPSIPSALLSKGKST